jgi:hypothetical protein
MTLSMRSLTTLFLLVTAGSIGCATTGARSGGHRDVHASATLEAGAARVLVQGPARLLHVDVETRDGLALYTAARNQGTDADCAAAGSERVRLHAGGSNRVNLAVGAGDVLCVTAPAARAAVMWHAEKVDGRGAHADGEMLALRDIGR